MKKILKQSSWLFGAQALGRLVGFFYTIFLARSLGVENFGLYSVALAYFSLFAQIADFGFNRYLIREIASEKKSASELLSSITFLRLTLTSVLFCLLAIVLYTLDPDKMRVHFILIATLAVVPQAVNQTLDAIFVALKKLQYSAVALILLNIVTTVMGVYLVSAGFEVMGGLAALVFGQLIYLFTLFIMLKSQKVSIIPKVEWLDVKDILKGSLPYGLLGILGLIYFRMDTLMLSYLRGNFETGIYGVAYRFLDAIIFIPSAVAAAMFPVIVQLKEVGVGRVKQIYYKSLFFMLAAGLAITALYIIILPFIIREFLPNYSSSIGVLSILALTIPFMFMHTPGVQVLLSGNEHLKQVIVLSIALVLLNAILNLTFIPKYGVMAAAWTTVVSEIVSFLTFFFLLQIRVFKR